MLDNQPFGILCPKCPHETKRTGRWLKDNPHLSCAQCGTDLSAHRDEVIEIIQACENTLAEDLARLRGQWQSR
jgi:hypothetical protein